MLTQGAETKRELFSSAAQLWFILAVIGVTVLVMTGMVLYRHHRRLRERMEPEPKRGPILDAWVEAGRRARPLPRDEGPDEMSDNDER